MLVGGCCADVIKTLTTSEQRNGIATAVDMENPE